jgi:pyruvate formate lyase activating enzyme
MKAIIFDIRSFSVHDGPGIRTTFFFKACPLRCAWCHNPESHHPGIQKVTGIFKIGQSSVPCVKQVGEIITLNQAISKAEADRLFYEESGGGITLSGGEPLMQADFVITLLEAAHQLDIHTAVDTSGYAPESVFKEVITKTNLVLFDLKIMEDAQHKKFTGKSNRLILENFKWLMRQKTEVIIRIPLIENITDTMQNLEAIRAVLKSTKAIPRIDLLPYHQTAYNKYKQLDLTYGLKQLPNYPIEKQQQIKTYFNDLAPVVSIGA